MPEMDSICQKWLNSVSANEAAIFPASDFHCGVVRTSSLLSRTSEQESYFVITWFLKGAGIFHTPVKDYPIRDNTVLIRRPDHIWSLTLDDRYETHRYYLQIPACMYELIKLMYPQLDSMEPLFEIRYDERIHSRFIELIQRMKELSSRLLYVLLPDMISLIMDITSYSASLEEWNMINARSMLERVADRTPLEEIARACNMPYSQFRKGFQKKYGISPGQYRIQFRINSAKQLLIEGYSVSTVAEMLNYPDIYSFSHQFCLVSGSPASSICADSENCQL